MRILDGNKPRAIGDQAMGDLLELGLRLKHDLGKHITMEQRWQSEAASSADRLTSLSTDVLATRRGPAGSSNAFQIWAEFRDQLAGVESVSEGLRVNLLNWPELINIEMNIASLRDVSVGLENRTLTDEQLDRAELATQEVAGSCRKFVSRLREEAARSI